MTTAYCFDLDGTLTKEEIFPLLSKEIGLFEEISALTEATIQGVIPFRKSFLLRCKLLSEIPLSKVRDIISNIPLYNDIVSFIHDHPDNCYIITGNLDAWVSPLITQLGCRFFCSRAEIEGNRLIRVGDVLNKADAINLLKKTHNKIVAVGDGMGDVSMFEAADTRIAFGGVHKPIQTLVQYSDFITFHEDSLCRLLSTL